MKVYLVCPVRNCDETQQLINDKYVKELESQGHQVHYPPRDVNQNCPTGVNIVNAHRDTMKSCDEVHIIWDKDSKGSHFDFGMAVGFNKPIKAISTVHEDSDGKSYWKVLKEYNI